MKTIRTLLACLTLTCLPGLLHGATAINYASGFESYTTIRTTEPDGPVFYDFDSGVHFQIEEPAIASANWLTLSWGLDMVLPAMANAFGLSGLAGGLPPDIQLKFFYFDGDTLSPVDTALVPGDLTPSAVKTDAEFNYVRIVAPTTSPDGVVELAHNSMRFGTASAVPEPTMPAMLGLAIAGLVNRRKKN